MHHERPAVIEKAAGRTSRFYLWHVTSKKGHCAARLTEPFREGIVNLVLKYDNRTGAEGDLPMCSGDSKVLDLLNFVFSLEL